MRVRPAPSGGSELIFCCPAQIFGICFVKIYSRPPTPAEHQSALRKSRVESTAKCSAASSASHRIGESSLAQRYIGLGLALTGAVRRRRGSHSDSDPGVVQFSSFTVLRAAIAFGVGCMKIRSRRSTCAATRHDEGMDLISEFASGITDLGYRALVVDDEAPLADVVASYLRRDHFAVTVCHTGAEALAVAREVDPDVVVLDLGLPGIDGLEVCRQLRTFSDAYVVMLTARDTEMDTIVGLSVGADDYVTKPFSPRELVARIRAMLRRPRTVGAPAAEAALPARAFGPLSIAIASRQVFLDDALIPLTRTEFDILAALSSRPGVVWSRRQLIDAVWGEPWVGNDHLVDVHVGHLRHKLADDPADPRFVFTVRGVGYRMGSGE